MTSGPHYSQRAALTRQRDVAQRRCAPTAAGLRGVKSFEELMIANFLTLHGVTSVYERPYEAATTPGGVAPGLAAG